MKVGDIVHHPHYGQQPFQVIALVPGGAVLIREMFKPNAVEMIFRQEDCRIVVEATHQADSGEDEADPMVAALNEALGSIDEAMEALREAKRLVESCIPRYA